MNSREEIRQFNRYLTRMREKRGVSLRQLCEGLCTSQEISFLESGRRLSNRLLLDAIMERLGVGAEDYEHFLSYTEYARWEARQRILHCITWEETERAKELLEEYYARYGEGNTAIEAKLERQFYLSMLAQVRRYDGVSEEELRTLFEEALRLTVPSSEHKPLSQLALSIKELNLLLETEQCRREGARLPRYEEILTYIEAAVLDGRGMAKIYPKAVFFLCRQRLAAAGEHPLPLLEIAKLLRLCNRAIDILRDNYRMYFLWELLDMRELLLEQMAADYRRQGEPKKADALRTMQQENTEWKAVLEQLYAEYQVPQETLEYCYLYVVHGVSCINDVIRIRRQMLGLTPAELCDGVCDIRTLRRLERRETMPQRAIVEQLFARLGLFGELTRTELITDDPEARRLMEQKRRQINDKQWEETAQLLQKLEARVSMDIPSNRQALMRWNMLLHWKKKELGNDAYCRSMREILELTLPFEAFLKKGEKYLTYQEQSCIHSMLQAMDKGREEFWAGIKCFEDMYRAIIDSELQDAFSGIYELIMNLVASEWGNKGEFERSDRYSDIITAGCLRLRRLGALTENLYNRCWNHAERRHRSIPTAKPLNEKKEIYKCILLSRLNKHKNDELYFKKMLEQASDE
ncbi:MAG: helix-turn-helix domain-containing protein [bacterium]|nr:helix-turn-helix domain-containing protein [bacterium]MCM1374348.1 helix-turn-helix domain-containing protein [Muribaculum sp.]